MVSLLMGNEEIPEMLTRLESCKNILKECRPLPFYHQKNYMYMSIKSLELKLDLKEACLFDRMCQPSHSVHAGDLGATK